MEVPVAGAMLAVYDMSFIPRSEVLGFGDDVSFRAIGLFGTSIELIE